MTDLQPRASGVVTARCQHPRCGRPLRTEESVARGYGPVCWRRMHPWVFVAPPTAATNPDQIPLPLENPVQFISLTENNDHEGETWRYWLQVDGNEDEIEHLRAAIAGADEEETYELADIDEAVPESDVDVLVKHTGRGYTTYENKVTGYLVLPDDFDIDDLYKGGVARLFTSTAH